MKNLTSEQQKELLSLISRVAAVAAFDNETNHQLNYWAIELKPKRVRKPKYPEETHESVIEDAYKEHTGQI